MITIRSSAIDSLAAGRRVNPADAPYLATLLTPNPSPIISTAAAAHDFRFEGIEFRAAAGVYFFDLLALGTLDGPVADLPYNLEFDRSYFHGDPVTGGKRGVFLNSGKTVITNSYFEEFKSTFQDAMAIAGCTGSGPFDIVNNHLEASGYPSIFGGCEGVSAASIPSDLTFSRNYVTRPLRWRGGPYVVKNLFELKTMRRALIDNNVFENNWVSGQNGFGILMTVRADYLDAAGKAFGVIEDITFSNNRVINSANGLVVLGHDNGHPGAGIARRITIRNNLFEKIEGAAFFLYDVPSSITIDHNTSVDQTGQMLLLANDNQVPGKIDNLILTNNIFKGGDYGLFGGGVGSGNIALETYATGSTVAGNVFIGVPSQQYPTGNSYVAGVEHVNFTNRSEGDYTLAPDSLFKGKATDGSDPGSRVSPKDAVSQKNITPRIQEVIHGVGSLVPGSRFVIQGENLSNCTVAAQTNPLPSTLCGTVVKINQSPVFLYSVAPDEITALLPSQLPTNTDMMLKVAVSGIESADFSVSVSKLADVFPQPYFYSSGTHKVAYVTLLDLSVNGPLNPEAKTRPMSLSESGRLWITGLGLTNPLLEDGRYSDRNLAMSEAFADIKLSINGYAQPVVFAGIPAGASGQFAIDFRIDPNTPLKETNILYVSSGPRQSYSVEIFLNNQTPRRR
jgi:uncharacterized protein (TIGR03437 family)